ncbi:STRA6-like [Latimeria chalumnae]|uniref:STRA6-like n=1 Tax=Latimeria chalumnae TaxID=7897 RepID=UPI00313B89C6
MAEARMGNVKKNVTCESSIRMDLFLHYSLIPAFFIILMLSFLQKRVNKMKIDERLALFNRRFGIVVPLDFIGTFSNRWSYGFAFGAVAIKVMFLFSEDYLPFSAPTWAKAIVFLVGALEVGLSYFPLFACLSTDFKIVGSLLGFLYSTVWLIVTVWFIAQCPHGEVIGQYEKVIFNWPSLLCLFFLLMRFVYMFVKAFRIQLGTEQRMEKEPFLQMHQAQHVQQLLKKTPQRTEDKSWFQRTVYEWDPNFRFPSRMIGTTIIALICLYIFVLAEYNLVTSYAFAKLRILEKSVEDLVSSSNDTEEYMPALVQLRQLVSVVEDTWLYTTFFASLTSISYVFHILACYRKHIKRLWSGEKSFLPIQRRNPGSAESVAAIARYSGWQIAYILWGYLIVHIVQFLFGLMIAYGFILPIKHNQGLELLKGLGISILTIGLVIGVMILQIVLAATFFLQAKISSEDKQKPLALNNRKAFHNFNYFFFFYNVILGLGTCLFRLICSFVVGSWLVSRIDRTIMQKGYEAVDMGFTTWVGMIFVDHYHSNPVLVSFCYSLLSRNIESSRYRAFRNVKDSRVSTKARTRWLLLYTLLNNPRLIILRKRKDALDSTPHQEVARERLALACVRAAQELNSLGSDGGDGSVTENCGPGGEVAAKGTASSTDA